MFTQNTLFSTADKEDARRSLKKLVEYVKDKDFPAIQSTIKNAKKISGSRWYEEAGLDDAILEAIFSKQIETVSFLLEQGVYVQHSIKRPDTFDSRSLIYFAVQSGYLPMVELLVGKDPKIIVPFDRGNNDAIEAAIQFNQPEIADYLLQHGAYLGESSFSETYLAHAATLGHTAVMRVLLKHDASILQALKSAHKQYREKSSDSFDTNKDEAERQAKRRELKENFEAQVQLLLDNAVGVELANDSMNKHYSVYEDFQFLEDIDASKLSFIGVSYKGEIDLLPFLEKTTSLKLNNIDKALFKEAEIDGIEDAKRRNALKENIAVCKQQRGFEITSNGLINLIPLWRAVLNNENETVAIRLAANVNPNEPNPNGTTPIEYAAKYGHKAIVEMLAQNEKIDKTTFINAINNAKYLGHHDIAEYLFECSPVNATDKDGKTLLHLAASDGNVEWVQHLLKMGADANQFDRNHHTPLIIAIKLSAYNEKKSLEIIKLLLAHGADPNLFRGSMSSPLEHAINPGDYSSSPGDPEVIDLLLSVTDKNALKRENLKTGEIYYDPWYSDLIFTAYFSKNPIPVLALLKKYGADFNVAQEYTGETLLNRALYDLQIPVLKFLLENGADPRVVDKQKETALHALARIIWPASPKYFDLFVQIASKMDERINAQDDKGITVLHWEVWKGNIGTVQYLIAHHANLDIQNNEGNTPLHVAALQGNVATMKLLFNAGANPDLINKEGFDFLELFEKHFPKDSKNKSEIKQMVAFKRLHQILNSYMDYNIHFLAQFPNELSKLVLDIVCPNFPIEHMFSKQQYMKLQGLVAAYCEQNQALVKFDDIYCEVKMLYDFIHHNLQLENLLYLSGHFSKKTNLIQGAIFASIKDKQARNLQNQLESSAAMEMDVATEQRRRFN